MPYQKIANTRVLVTGGAGFLPIRQAGIGSNLREDFWITNFVVMKEGKYYTLLITLFTFVI